MVGSLLSTSFLAGLRPHIAQVIAGHRDINVTLGYKAVYTDEVIRNHLAFLARRRAQRPTDEYRTPTSDEWQQFLGHFERRKVSAARLLGPVHDAIALLGPHPWGLQQLPRVHGVPGRHVDSAGPW